MRDPERAPVTDAMHRGVVSCDEGTSGFAVARMMAAHRIHCVVVRADDQIPRVVTDSAVAAAIYDSRLGTSSALELSRAAVLVHPDDSVGYALERLHEQASTHAIVVGRTFRPLGVVSVLDLVEWSLRVADATGHP